MPFDAVLQNSQLGKAVTYGGDYNPGLLFAVPRIEKRLEQGLVGELPFQGVDLWHAYEISWLNAKGKPHIAIGEFLVPCTSQHIIESKSFKLYLNSFNQTRFESTQAVIETMQRDLSALAQATVSVKLITPDAFASLNIEEFPGTLLDDFDISATEYQLAAHHLTASSGFVKEAFHSHLLKSNCPITGQPDWASVLIHYEGKPIDAHGLLRYIISYRQTQEFHEDCAERIFMDIMQHCQPEKLSVYLRYTRRGGLDINPFRSNFESLPALGRCARQ